MALTARTGCSQRPEYSCEQNDDVDFFFYTDQNIESERHNIHIIKTTFYEVKNRFQSLYDFTIKLDTPYDLCDYKVAYGEAFSEELKEFDFWGYCDTDVIFGNIRRFITNSILENNDKILIRGHFTLFKNNDEINSCYRGALPDGRIRYKEVFSQSGIHHFDEGLPDIHEGINAIFKERFGWGRVYDEYIFMDLCVTKFQFINADFVDDDIEIEKSTHSIFLWDNGRLYRIRLDLQGKVIYREEFMYMHFQKRDMKTKIDSLQLERFYIVPNYFLGYEASSKKLYHANDNKVYWSYIYKCWYSRAKRILKRVLSKKLY